MSLTPVYTNSTDASAPSLAGVAGSLITLLDAVLVNGYGAGPTAKAGLGWTKVWTGTNRACYQNNPVTGSGRYLYVDDSGGGAGGAKEALVVGYRSFDADTGVGTDMFPTSAQQAATSVWKKSNTADATARPWLCVGNERVFYLGMDSSTTVRALYEAGDFHPFKPGDLNNFIVCGGVTQNVAANALTSRALVMSRESEQAATAGFTGWAAAKADGTVSAQMWNLGNPYAASSSSSPYGGSVNPTRPYPGVISGGLDVMQIVIAEGSFAERGHHYGVYAPNHSSAFTDLQLMSGAGPHGGDMLAVSYRTTPTSSSATLNGQVMFELGVEW